MGVSHILQCIFHLTWILKRPEDSIHWKGKAVDSTCSSTSMSGPSCTEVQVHYRHLDDDSNNTHLAVSGSESGSGSSSSRLVRVVSWASIASGHRSGWTVEQERELVIAEHELGRCQKAWSSEQELWLEYIKVLSEEKEAHEEFIHHRAKQELDEQQHFRKAWSRRKSIEESRNNIPRIGKLRRNATA